MKEKRLGVPQGSVLGHCLPLRVVVCAHFAAVASECYGRTDQASQCWSRVDWAALQGNRPSLDKWGMAPLFYEEPLAFIDETNVCV